VRATRANADALNRQQHYPYFQQAPDAGKQRCRSIGKALPWACSTTCTLYRGPLSPLVVRLRSLLAFEDNLVRLDYPLAARQDRPSGYQRPPLAHPLMPPNLHRFTTEAAHRGPSAGSRGAAER
jgi:hypothetical protein